MITLLRLPDTARTRPGSRPCLLRKMLASCRASAGRNVLVALVSALGCLAEAAPAIAAAADTQGTPAIAAGVVATLPANPDLPSAALSVEAGASGREVMLLWTWLNESDREQSVTVPASIEVAATTGGRVHRLPGLLVANDAGPGAGPITLGPGQFRRIRYRMEVPSTLSGPTVFRVSGAGRSLVAFADALAPAAIGAGAPPGPPSADVTAPAVGGPTGPAAVAAAPPGAAQARLPLTDRLGSAISAHEPVYIAFGDRQRRNARFQISFKYRFFNEEGDLARGLVPLRHLYFGYTQTALWDLESDSAPFRDSSYRPSLFYRNDALWVSAAKDARLGIATGLEHESNGRDGLSSRSINMAFVRPMLRLGDPSGWHLTLGPKLYGYLDRTGNADIARYRGHADLFASVGHPDRWQFSATVRRGTGSGFGSTLLEATYPLRTVSLGNLDGYFYFQYFNGYGESILDYDRRFPAQFRIGFAITRWP